MDDVRLVGVTEHDKPVLANLLQFYCYEFSAIRGYDVTEHGVFTYKYLDHYFVEADRDAYFVRHGDALAGFAMSRELTAGEREVAEFFVMRWHRRAGVGRRAAHRLFGLHPGSWVVAFDDANTGAAAFWPEVVARAATGEIVTEQSGGRTILRFVNLS